MPGIKIRELHPDQNNTMGIMWYTRIKVGIPESFDQIPYYAEDPIRANTVSLSRVDTDYTPPGIIYIR